MEISGAVIKIENVILVIWQRWLWKEDCEGTEGWSGWLAG